MIIYTFHYYKQVLLQLRYYYYQLHYKHECNNNNIIHDIQFM